MIQLNKECLHCVKSLKFQTSIVVDVFLKQTFSVLEFIYVAFTVSSLFYWKQEKRPVT